MIIFLKNKYIYIYIFTFLYSFCIYSQEYLNDSLKEEYKIFYYTNGQKASEGIFVNGKPNKYWKTYDENGVLHSEGNRKDFELDSIWKFYDKDGKLFMEVNYINGKKNGVKKTYYENEIIVENFIDDVKNGMTIYYYPNMRIKKEIYFENGREQGISKEYSIDGTIIGITEYKNGFIVSREKINRTDIKGLKQGVWKEFWENGNVKTECFYNSGKKDGYFKEYDIKGNLINIFKYVNDSLVVDSKETKKLDVKTEYYPNGVIKKQGSFKNDIPEGVMREYSPEGKIINSKIYSNGIVIAEGIVDEKGLYQGYWKEFYESGNIKSEGEYFNGKRKGNWKFYYEDGSIEQIGSYNYKGNKDGSWKWYYQSGKIKREENFKDGLEDGLFKEYDENGKVIVQGEYVDGYEEGFWFYDIGEERVEGNYVGGNRDGIWKVFYKDGKLAFLGKFSDDVPDGKHIYYYTNGYIKEEGTYVMGLKHGNWRKYNESDGTLFLDILYKNGVEKKYNGVPIKPDIN